MHKIQISIQEDNETITPVYNNHFFDVGHFLKYNLAYGPTWSVSMTALAEMPLHTSQSDHISNLF